MQGIVFMPQNSQGSPPPTNNSEMEVSPKPNLMTKEKLFYQSSRSDSGIFSATNTTIDQTATSETGDSDNRSDCSSPERKYLCPICDTMLTSQHDFTLHIRSHNNEVEIQDNEKGFTCRICQKVLSSSSSLDRHVLVHSGERPFHCKYCGDTFTTNGNMHRHMRTHSNKPENYESDGSTDSNVSSSKSTEYNNNKIEKINNKRKLEHAMEESNKRLHSDNETPQSFRCPVCERSDFNTVANLEMHLEDNHPDYPAKCNQCNQVFSNNKLLITHKNTVHESNMSRQPVIGFKDLTFVDFSSEKFPHIARYECETNLHKVTGGLKFQCKKCLRAFPCSSSLEIHEKSCGDLSNGLDLTKTNISDTEIKRMEFFSRLNLQDNSPEKYPETQNKLREQLVKAIGIDNTKDLADIQSIISNISLQQLQNKQNEMRLAATKSHADISTDSNKTEQEEETQDVFAVEFRKMKLRGEFPCRLCTAVFPNLRALKGHNRAHLNGNNNGTYHCNMCPHSSIDKAALIRHMRTHNGDRPYECSLCNYAFTTKANCERHLRNRHSKTTREEVKKSIIYHPSEDPTNEDLNKLATREDGKKLNISSSTDGGDLTPEKIHCSTPKIVESLKPNFPLLPDLHAIKQHLPLTINKEPPKMFINDIIRNENLRSLKEHKILLPQQYSYHHETPQNLSKIQVRSLEALKDGHLYNDNSEDEYIEEEEEEPMDLVLDLSKKKMDEEKKRVVEEEEIPQDLTKKSPPFTPPFSINELLQAQQILKNQPKIDPATLFQASQWAHMYRNSFPGLNNWNFPLNPLLFPSIPSPLAQNSEDLKNKMRMQMCGGSMINDFKALQNMQQQALRNNIGAYNGFPLGDNKPEIKMTPKKPDDLKPLNIETNFTGGLMKMQSPIPQGKPDIMQSPNSVKMVIKNGVLMPKQKQRRYRTERPFTCEHCSARFTLRSNMERHIKQQHPQFWSQRQRGNVGNPGRKSQGMPLKPNYCDLSIPNFEVPKIHDYEEAKDHISEKIKFAILAQQLRVKQEVKKEEDEDCALVIDENEEKGEFKTEDGQRGEFPGSRILEEKLKELKAKCKSEKLKNEEDLVPVSRLLDNASQQQFKEYFKRDNEEHEVGVGSEEDEDGLVASGSTSEGNISGTDENRSESDTTVPVKKKSAYSLAPNRVSCPYCSRKFPWTSSLRRHILTHTGQKPFKCSHCPLLFTTKSNCDRHLLRKHGNAATTITNETANSNSQANYLMRNVPERPFKCSSCPSSTFSTYSNLKKHISCKHSTNAQGDDIKAQGYEAGSSEDEKVPGGDWESQLSFSKLPLGNSEGQTPNSDLPFKCHLCEGSFGERQDALDHIRNKHASEYDLLMSKNALDANATTPDDATHHEDEENEIRGKFPDYSNRKVICAFCMRRFWSAEDLRRHMRTHTGERPFSCDICKRRFTLKHSMLRHRKKHNLKADGADGDLNTDDDNFVQGEDHILPKTDESDCNETGDLISNLLGIRDRSIIDKVLGASADDAAKLLGVKNGVRE